MVQAAAVVVALLLPRAVESWAPKKYAPVDLASMRISRGAGGARTSRAAAEQPQRRQLQEAVGNYDLNGYEATTRATAHWDASQIGLSGYSFDQQTHQGARKERFGYDPLPQIRTRDPNAPPTPAEMYPRMLNMDPEEQMLELAEDYARRQVGKKGAYNPDWCQRSAILPGQSGCSTEKSTGDSTNLDVSGDARQGIQALIDAAMSVLSASDDAATP